MSFYQSLFNTQTVNATIIRFAPGANIGYFLSSADTEGTFKWVPIGDFAVQDILSTANQTTISDNGHGVYTIGTVQDINTTSTPEFSAIKLTSGASNGYILKSNGSGLASWESLGNLAVTSITGVNNQTVITNNNGNYTIGTPQDIGTNSSVQFSTITTDNHYNFKNSTITIYKQGTKLLFSIDGSNAVFQIESNLITGFQPLSITNLKVNSIDAQSGTDISFNNHTIKDIDKIYAGTFSQFKGTDPELLLYNDQQLSRLRLISANGKNYIQSAINASAGSSADLIISSLNDVFEWIKFRASQQDIQSVSILPFTDNARSLGSQALRWNNGFINYLYGLYAEIKTQNPSVLIINDDNNNSSIMRFVSSNQANYIQSGLTLNGGSTADFVVGNIYNTFEWLRCVASSQLIETVTIQPKITLTYNLGSTTKKFNNIYVDKIYGQIQDGTQSLITSLGTLSSLNTNNAQIYFTNSVLWINDNSSLLRLTTSGGSNYIQSAVNTNAGSQADLIFSGMYGGNQWMKLRAATNDIQANSILPMITSTYNLGSGSLVWNNIYANQAYLAKCSISNTAGINQTVEAFRVDFQNNRYLSVNNQNFSGTNYTIMKLVGSVQSGQTAAGTIFDMGNPDELDLRLQCGTYNNTTDSVNYFVNKNPLSFCDASYTQVASLSTTGDFLSKSIQFSGSNQTQLSNYEEYSATVYPTGAYNSVYNRLNIIRVGKQITCTIEGEGGYATSTQPVIFNNVIPIRFIWGAQNTYFIATQEGNSPSTLTNYQGVLVLDVSTQSLYIYRDINRTYFTTGKYITYYKTTFSWLLIN